MPPEVKPDAIPDSSTGKNGDTPPPKGKSDATPSLENLQGENKRLSEKLSKIQSDLEESGSVNDELKEELAEIKKSLASGKPKNAQEKLNDLRNNPEYKEQLELLTQLSEESAAAKAKDIVFQEQLDDMDDILSERAEELNMEKEELRKALQPYAAKYKDKLPVRRVKLALKEYLSFKVRLENLDKREKEAKEKEESDKLYAETGGRTPREVTSHDALKKADGDAQKIGDALTALIG